MPKRFATKIGLRDLQILAAIDRTPLTVAQLLKLSQTFDAPYTDFSNLRRRLRLLAESGLVRAWPYAFASTGRSPDYYRLTFGGYRLLNDSVEITKRRQHQEIGHARHFHSYALAEFIVHLHVSAHQQRVQFHHFQPENSLKIETNEYSLYPDCAFRLTLPDGRHYNYLVELDNSSERLVSSGSMESIERKIVGYDVHQSQYSVHDPNRYLVVFLTTKSESRLNNILNLAAITLKNPDRRVVLAAHLPRVLASDPLCSPIFLDHRMLRCQLVPTKL